MHVLDFTTIRLRQTRICLGHYASKGFSNPLKSLIGAAKYQVIEITDFATIRMKRGRTLQSVLALIFPYPLRYKQVWHLARQGKSLYAWKPQAPEGSIALGMICTATGLYHYIPPHLSIWGRATDRLTDHTRVYDVLLLL